MWREVACDPWVELKPNVYELMHCKGRSVVIEAFKRIITDDAKGMYRAEAQLELGCRFLEEESDGCPYLVGCFGLLLVVWTILRGELGKFLEGIRAFDVDLERTQSKVRSLGNAFTFLKCIGKLFKSSRHIVRY